MIVVENRVLRIPQAERIIGARGENGVQKVQFSLSRYQGGIDLWPLAATVEVADEATGEVYFDLAEKALSAGGIIVSWAIGRHHTGHGGDKRINLRFMDEDAKVVWKSLTGFVTVADAVCAEEGWDGHEPPPSVFEQAVASCAASVQKAEDAAENAHTEAERAAAIDAYTKGASDSRFASPLTGSAAGQAVYITDAAAGYGLTAAVYTGRTAETGSGEKGPLNPYIIQGLSPAQIHVDGKNILDIQAIADNIISAGGGAQQTKIGGELCLRLNVTTSSVNQVVPLHCLPGAYTFTYRYYIDSTERYGFRFDILYTDGTVDSVVPTKFKSWDTIVKTTNPAKTVMGLKRIVITGTVVQYLALTCQFEYGTAATSFAAYAGKDYTLPAVSLYHMDNMNTADTYNAVTGEISRRVGSRVFTGTEKVSKLDANCNAESNLYYITNIPLSGSTVDIRCTHFPTDTIVSASSTDNGIIANPTGRMIYFRLRLDSGITSAAEVMAWMASQKAAGTPVTILYIAEEPETAACQPVYITQPSAAMTLSSDASVEVTYTRDTNGVIQSLMDEITALKNRLPNIAV